MSDGNRTLSEQPLPSFEYVLAIWPKPCFMCKQPTYFIEINYMGPLCSDECDRKAAEDAARR